MGKPDVIHRSYVFERLSTGQVQKLASISREETYEAGQYIFREGEQARSLFVIEDGTIELKMKITVVPERRKGIATADVITKGATFGWSAVVEPHTFIGSAKAVVRCKVVAIDGGQLTQLMDSDHTMGYEVMKRFSQAVHQSASGQMSKRKYQQLKKAISYPSLMFHPKNLTEVRNVASVPVLGLS